MIIAYVVIKNKCIMTIQELHNFFDLMQDKYNAPYFITEEKDMFINAAQLRFINDIIFRDILGHRDTPKGNMALYGMEDKINTSELLSDIIISNYAITLTTTGKITKSYINNIINNLSEGSKLMHLLSFVSSNNSMNYKNNIVFRWLRDNDRGKFLQNSFKKPTSNKPYFMLSYNSYDFLPSPSSNETIYISFVRTPKKVSYTDNVTIELPEFVHYDIVALALDLAGVATADKILIESSNLTK